MLAPLLLLAGLGVRGLQVSRSTAREQARVEAGRRLDLIFPAILTDWRELRQGAIQPKMYEVPPQPAPPSEAQRLYEQACALPAGQAAPLFARIAEEYPDARAASGVPLLPLIAWARLRETDESGSWAADAERAARAAVETAPSILTPEILAGIAGLLDGRGLEDSITPPWRRRWESDERAREVVRARERLLASATAPLWLETPSGSWWAERLPGPAAWRLLPADRLQSLVLALQRTEPALPGYAVATLTLDDRPLLAPSSAGEILARRGAEGLELAVILADPAQLFAQQRQQSLWLAALLACGLAGSVAAFWAMQRALARERQLGALKSDFVSSVSHELRAPMASMRLMAENLATGAVADDDRKGEYHHFIAEECQRLSALIENVLDFARIEQRRKSYDFAETDVIALARDTIQLASPRARQRRQTIESELAPIEPPPLCDGLAVRQALLNLLDNAMKFSADETAILVRIAPETGGWTLSVQDHGIGIAAGEQAKIFERFYRVGSELRRETQGAGIGLAIVRHIADAHGARVEVESRPGAGARFTLHFPADPCPAS